MTQIKDWIDNKLSRLCYWYLSYRLQKVVTYTDDLETLLAKPDEVSEYEAYIEFEKRESEYLAKGMCHGIVLKKALVWTAENGKLPSVKDLDAQVL